MEIYYIPPKLFTRTRKKSFFIFFHTTSVEKSSYFSCFQFAEQQSGLPDGLISNQKSQLGLILVGLRLENVDIFYGHWEYLTVIWDIL
jgi:hypothetical protein